MSQKFRTPGVDFTNVFRARFSQNITRKKTFVLNMRAKNACENVGEIDPRRKLNLTSFRMVLDIKIFLLEILWRVISAPSKLKSSTTSQTTIFQQFISMRPSLMTADTPFYDETFFRIRH